MQTLATAVRENNEKTHQSTGSGSFGPLFLLPNVDNCYRKWTVLAAPRGSETMLLREHPLFSYHGMHSWPPVWTWMAGGYDWRPRGEVGILRRVEKPKVLPANKCFLYIDYEDASYIGCLLCSDHAFCSQIVRILEAHLNKTIAEIGSIDLTHTL